MKTKLDGKESWSEKVEYGAALRYFFEMLRKQVTLTPNYKESIRSLLFIKCKSFYKNISCFQK